MLDPRGALDIDRKERRRLIPRQYMPKQPPSQRIFNFDEVYLGFDAETARIEASRCLQCPHPAPCQLACPLHNDIPAAMWLIAQGDFLGAAARYRLTSNLPEICGRVCPQEKLCQGSCAVGKHDLPVYMGRLEAFVADYQRRTIGCIPPPRILRPTGRRVAVVGAGPAGMTVAEELRRRGHAITVFEALPRPGGLLVYGIPSFKLNKDRVVRSKIDQLYEMGIEFVFNTFIGKDITVDQLIESEDFDAVFLGTGTWINAKMEVPGEDLKGIYEATDFLMKFNLPPEYLPERLQGPMRIGKRVAVIGGGDTAMDCVRTAIRAGAEEVTCVYRRTEAEMPGKIEERNNAREEGVKFEWLTAPIRFIGNSEGWVEAMECIRMALGEPDKSGRRRPVPQKGTEFIRDVDTVVTALGYWPDPIMGKTTRDLETDKWGLIKVDKATGRTSRREIFAAGDNVHGADLVVTAVAAARRAALAMNTYLLYEVN